MMRSVSLFAVAIILLGMLGCQTSVEKTPRDTVFALLDLHGLRGRLPEDRPRDVVDRPVSPEKLKPLFTDLQNHDAFIGDLYVGFVVGALARYQSRLFETRTGSTATFKAGQAEIHLALKDGVWRIVLEKSIPDPLKKRAAEEKRRYEAAKAAGQAVK